MTALSKLSVPIFRQSLNVRRSRKAGPVVVPWSVTSMLNVSERFGAEIAAIEDLRHHFIAKIKVGAFDARLARRDQQPHELRCARGRAIRLAQFRDGIELPDARLLIDAPEREADLPRTATPAPRRVTVVSGALRNSTSLMKSVCEPPISSCVMKLAVRRGPVWFPIGRRIQLADHRKRAHTARRVSAQHVEYLAMTSAALPLLK